MRRSANKMALITAVFYCLILIGVGGCAPGNKIVYSKAPLQALLLARDAAVTGGLRVQDAGTEKATIHGWNNTGQKISWNINLKPGNYKVLLNYAEPYPGAAIAVSTGEQRLVALIELGDSWRTYRDQDLGVIKISARDHEIVLQVIQLSLVKNTNGKLVNKEALPDVYSLTLLPTAAEQTSEFARLQVIKGRPLFDGKTFNGWIGNNGSETMKWFRIENGAIIGGSMTKNIPQNEFLRTAREYENFELRLQFKMGFTDNSYNAGVQFRSRPQTAKGKEFEMIGYQADIFANGWGVLYDEQRRWDFLGTPLVNDPPHDPSGWNSYVIRCEGPRIRIWLNDVQTLDYIEPFVNAPHPDVGQVPLKGYIALQIHSGKPCEVSYRNISIQELP